jgi:hypothetical protein
VFRANSVRLIVIVIVYSPNSQYSAPVYALYANSKKKIRRDALEATNQALTCIEEEVGIAFPALSP